MKAALQRVWDRGGYQTELPGVRPDGGEAPAEQLLETAAETREPARQFGQTGSGALAEVLLWIILAIAVVVVALSLFTGLRDRQATPVPEEGHPGSRAGTAAVTPGAPSAAREIPDHERLAAEGRFAEAVHSLLLVAFRALAQQRSRPIPAAETGREILASVGGFATGDTALVSIFRTVERSHFGGAPVDRVAYGECVGLYDQWRSR